MRHMLKLRDYSAQELQTILDIAAEVKEQTKRGVRNDYLKNRVLVMLFQKTSTRTRTSFEAGMAQLGGHAIFLDWKSTQFQMAKLEDEACCINRYADLVMARLLRHDDLLKIASVSTVPVINGLCEKYHPCQIMADLLTMREHLGKLEGKKVVYVGIANNVSNSLSVGCTKLGMRFTLCVPRRHEISLDGELLAEVRQSALYEETSDVQEAIKDADILYTDSWVDMEFFLDPAFKEEKEKRISLCMPYQLNQRLLESNPKALVMHDLPAHRGYEIDDYAMESDRSIMFDQAENRLHAQKGILMYLLGVQP